MVIKPKEKRAPRKRGEARKRKGDEPAKLASPDVDVAGPVHWDGSVYLSKADLAAVKLAQYAIDQARRDTEIVNLRSDKIRNDFEAAKRAFASAHSSNENDRLAASRAMSSASEAYGALLAALGKAYGVDFTRVTFEPTTGRLYVGETPIAAE